ncbi:MAG: hypothetical protein AMXMBFR82_04210 [Candidatus Hydrogenedentota bacterium]
MSSAADVDASINAKAMNDQWRFKASNISYSPYGRWSPRIHIPLDPSGLPPSKGEFVRTLRGALRGRDPYILQKLYSNNQD